MPASDLYILPENVQLIPVKEIAEHTRAKFEYNEDDFIITYSNARNTSKVIDSASAGLLNEFKKPSSIIEGIYKYSFINKLDPQETLEQAYDFLSRLRSEGFLALYDEHSPESLKDVFQKGESFKDYEVVAKIQGISDTEVYKLEKENSFYVLKILKPAGNSLSLADQFYNELKILEYVKDSNIAPGLIESGELDGNLYMILIYCDGASCDAATEKYRNLDNHDNLMHLVTITINILTAYETLHGYGVVHSDIHPRNILINEAGQVKIIDFGLAQFEGKPNKVLRGGISFFYDPEYAQAVSNRQNPPPPVSYAGEQYAVAALVYFLFTGKQYLNFSLEREVLLQQVINEPPVTFHEYDIDIELDVAPAILKALAKNPEQRYPSMKDFKTAFIEIQNDLAGKNDAAIEKRHSFISFCDTIKKRFGFNGPFITNGLQVSPISSVNYGAAGIAWMYYRMALIDRDPELLSLADVWVNRAYDYGKNYDAAFYSSDIDITKKSVGDISIYHTSSGVHLMYGLVSKALGDYNTFYQSVMNFMEDAARPSKELDLTLGKSSVLIGCKLLFENIDKEQQTLQEPLLQFGNKVMTEIWDTVNSYDDLSKNTPLLYRGIAHGWAGILYATLQWCRQSNTPCPDSFFDRVNQLFKSGIREKNYMRWPLTNTDPASWPGWCHGSAGYTFLWCVLYKITGDETYLEAAKLTANHFLATDPFINSSLCCGMAGECYALLSVFNLTNDEFYLDQARKLANRLLLDAYTTQTRNNSLYKGDIGIAVLLTELKKPQYARMPLFE